jgi:formylmethanofuran dehydrogenase subunit E
MKADSRRTRCTRCGEKMMDERSDFDLFAELVCKQEMKYK